MSPSSRIRTAQLVRTARLGIVAAAALAVGAVAAPAVHATDATTPYFLPDVSPDITMGAAGSTGTAVPIRLYGRAAEKPLVVLDLSGLSSIGTVELPKPCVPAGTKATCELPSGNVSDTLPLLIHPTAKAGATGTFSVLAKANNTDVRTVTAKVTLVDGVDLVALEPVETLGDAKPGDVRYTPMVFANTGNRPASGFTMSIWFDRGVQPFEYTGCAYAETPNHGTQATCKVDQPVEPGTTVRWVTLDEHDTETDGYGAGFAPDAYGPKGVGFSVEAAGEVDAPLGKLSAKSGTGTKRFALKAVSAKQARALDINPGDNVAEGFYEVANTVDLATIGATASGKVGDIVTITIGEKNNGPASLDWSRAGGEPGAHFQFVPPPGVQVAKAPNNCESVIEDGPDLQHVERGASGGSFYRCWTIDYLGAGDTISAPFELKITQVIPNATGTVSFHDPYRVPQDPPADANPSNDKALVVINPTTGGTGGGSGDGLPITGSQAGLAGGVGLALVVLGAGLYVASRRRRVTAAGDDDAGA
ncbi:hypothetical protein ACNTMW_00395 [Planosporangium sp. 12N6]|uniref:hypothetical protein n=1 Tax=Planosporangium spinosum TaxID=3402278 RepID=UPI003CF514AD